MKRLPYRRGFVNRNRVEYQAVNLDDLARFEAGSVIGPDELVAAGIVDDKELIKVLAMGELPHALTVRAHRFSKTARERIESAGGQVEELSNGNDRRAD